MTWLLRSWGDGEFILRLPAAIAGVFTVFAVYLLGKELFGRRAGLVAALLTSVSPYMVWYSQEARNYSLLMLLTTLQMYFAYTAVTRSRRTDWLGLAVATTLNLYTHYLAFIVTAAITIFIGGWLFADLLRGTTNRAKGAAVGVLLLAGAAAAIVPWRPVLRTVYTHAAEVAAWARLYRAAAIASAVILLVLLVVLAVVFRSRTRVMKVAATTLLATAFALMLLALKVLPLTSIDPNALLLYSVALGVVGAGLAIAAALLVLELLKPPAAVERRLGLALAAGALVALAYTPWLPYLRLALSRPDTTIGRVHFNGEPSLGDLLNLLSRLGISGVLLGAFVLGLVVLGVWLFRGRAGQSALVLISLGVPILILLRSSGPAIVGIDVFYLAFMVPTAIIVMAAGAEAVPLGLTTIRRLRPNASPGLRTVPAAASLVVIAALLAQALPALATSYMVPKEDYRSAAEHIAAASPAGSVLLAVGNYSDWAVICFDYYFRELHSSVTVVDGLKVTSDTAATLASGGGVAWGVVIFPSADQLALIRRASDLKTDFVDVTGIIHVLRPIESGLSTTRQAQAVLQSELRLEPQLSATLKLLDLLAGQAQAGPNLVPDPAQGSQVANGWSLGPGVTLDSGSLLMTTTASRAQVNAAFTTQIAAVGDYVVGFDCRNDGLSGPQTVDLLPLDASGHPLPTFAGASPYQCPHVASWTRSYFAIRLPDRTAGIALILGAQGTGVAEFRALQLGLLQELP